MKQEPYTFNKLCKIIIYSFRNTFSLSFSFKILAFMQRNLLYLFTKSFQFLFCIYRYTSFSFGFHIILLNENIAVKQHVLKAPALHMYFTVMHSWVCTKL